MTSKDIQDYIEIDLGKDLRHDPEMLLEAAQETASTFDLDEWGVLRLVLANESMTGTHSYGFHTAYGRAIIENFKFIYQS